MPPARARARRERARVVAPRGDIDLAAASRLQSVLGEAAARPGRLVLDLSEAGAVSDEGAALLLNAVRRLARAGRAPTVICPTGPLRELLDRRGLARRLELLGGRAELEASRAAAAASTDGGSAGDGTARWATAAVRQRASTPGRRSTLLAEATLVIEDRHAELGLSLADVARQIATSERQLQRIFSELAGSSFRDELVAVRMQHAAELLSTTELPVGAVARRVGYRQPAQFAKAFRRHHGLAPSQFRTAAAAGRGGPFPATAQHAR